MILGEYKVKSGAKVVQEFIQVNGIPFVNTIIFERSELPTIKIVGFPTRES